VNSAWEEVECGGGEEEPPREDVSRREDLLDIETLGVWNAESAGEGVAELEPTASSSEK
jgi:hypothetical protein